MEVFGIALAFLMGLISLVGGVIIIVVAIQQHTKKVEMRHRERLAMIERGLLPSPATDPAAFEAAMRRGGSSRFVSAGVAIVGLGLALMLLIGFAGGAPGPAVGVGGAIVVLGAAFLLNGYLQRQYQPPPPRGTSGSSMGSPLGPPDRPGPSAP